MLPKDLPDFEHPPVVEVAVSLQFTPLDLRAAHFGILWERLRGEGYSRTEDHGDLEPAFEQFEVTPTPEVGVRFRTFDDAPPLPRVWFLNEAQNELVQVQRDRLIVNWRQGARSEPYPRYSSIIKRHRSALSILADFASDEKLGKISATQCEITYVNHVQCDSTPSQPCDQERVFTTWRNRYSDSYLETPEDVQFMVRYRMNDDKGAPLGRLHISVSPARRASDRQPILVMNLTARGAPYSTEESRVYGLFDREHEWIVRGFASITTREMHSIWRRKDGN